MSSRVEPDEDCRKVKHREIVSCGFFVACGNPAEMLNAIEEAFHQVALLVQMPVTGTFFLATASGWNDGVAMLLMNLGDERFGIVALVAEDVGIAQRLDQRNGLGDVVSLAPGQGKAKGIA